MTKVLKAFQDKTDGIIYYAGDDYAGERVEELAEAGFLEAEAEAEETDEEPEVIESVFDAILYLEEKRDWLYIHTVTKEL